jgi:hypothetical protein
MCPAQPFARRSLIGLFAAFVVVAAVAPAALAAPPAPSIQAPPTPPSGIYTAPPTFTITSDQPDATISWNATDGSSGSGPSPVSTGAIGVEGANTLVATQTVPGDPETSPAATKDFSLDSIPPPPPATLAGPSSPTTDNTPTFTWTGLGPTFEWQVRNAAGAVVRGPTTTAEAFVTVGPALADGTYYFDVREIDAADNVGPFATWGPFTVDVNPPLPFTTNTPASGAAFNAATAPGGVVTFSWDPTSDDGVGLLGYQLLVDDAEVASTGPGVTSATLPIADGSHTWQVRAVDGLGHERLSNGPVAFSVDRVPPATPRITAGPPPLGNDNTPTFSWAAGAGGAASYRWKVTGNSVRDGTTTDTSVTVAPSNFVLKDDPTYVFQLWQVDRAGNESAPASYAFGIDATKPTVASVAPPPPATGVGLLVNVSVTFREASGMDPATLTSSTLRLCREGVCIGSGLVPAAVVPGRLGATIDPVGFLEPNTNYEVVFTPGSIRDAVGNTLAAPSQLYQFRTGVDTLPPGPPTGLAIDPGVGILTLGFAPPGDPDLAKVRVLRRTDTYPRGPADPDADVLGDLASGVRSFTDGGLTPGRRYFYALYAFDLAGNPSAEGALGTGVPLAPPPPSAVAPPQILGPPAVAPLAPVPRARPRTQQSTGVKVAKPATLRAHLLSPRAGAKIRVARPLLRWRGLPKGTTLVNLQIFLFRNQKKVLSRFPRGTSFRVPAGVLKPGNRYVWRIWPYIGRLKRYSAKPLAMSYLDMVKKPTPRKAPVKRARR